MLAVQLYPTLCDPTDWPTRLLCPWDSPGKSTEVSCYSQGIFPTQGLNPGLLHCRQVLYLLTTTREKPEMYPLIASTILSWLILEIVIKANKTKPRSTKLKDFWLLWRSGKKVTYNFVGKLFKHQIICRTSRTLPNSHARESVGQNKTGHPEGLCVLCVLVCCITSL